MHTEYVFFNGYSYKIIQNQINKFFPKARDTTANSDYIEVSDTNKYFLAFLISANIRKSLN